MSDINPSPTGGGQMEVDPLIQLEIDTGQVITDEKTRTDIVAYLSKEIKDVFGGNERKQMEEDWKKWRRQREARPEVRSKSFPWENASNVVPPLAMTSTNGIFSMLKGKVGSKKPLWMVGSEDRTLAKQAIGFGAFIGILAESPYHINMRGVQDTILFELASMGTQFVKVPWTIERWNLKRKGGAQGTTETISKISRDCPTIQPIALEDFGTRTHWSDIQRAPWIATRHWLYEHELLQRQQQGVYTEEEVAKVVARGADEITDAKKEEMDRMGLIPKEGDTQTYAIFECFLFWDTDGDGIPEDIKVWYDPVSDAILRSEYNELGVRDIVRLLYIPRPNELYGIGVGWIVEHMQDEIEALHNMRVDGTMLSMLQMYVTRRGSGAAPMEEFHPLKNIQVDNPREDFVVVKFPDIGQTSIQAEMLIKEYADRATSASDAMMGYESRSTSARTTFGGTQFLAGQGAKVFNSIAAGVEAGLSEIGQLIAYQLVANRERAMALVNLMPLEAQPYVEQVLQLEVTDIPSTFKFQIQSTDIEQTEEAKRQIKLTLVQLYAQYGKEIFAMLPVIYSPQTPPEVQQIGIQFYVGATKLMENVFQSFGEKQTEDYIPYVRDLEMLLATTAAMKDQQLAQAGRSLANAGTPGQGGGGPIQAPPGVGGGAGGISRGGGMAPPQAPTGPSDATAATSVGG